jgi:hypothetical protein
VPFVEIISIEELADLTDLDGPERRLYRITLVTDNGIQTIDYVATDNTRTT